MNKLQLQFVIIKLYNLKLYILKTIWSENTLYGIMNTMLPLNSDLTVKYLNVYIKYII